MALIEGQAATRLADLVPIRHARMAANPFAYYRGAALPMAADLSTVPTSGIEVQLCGDAHLSNFGIFASPERELVFDVNDFDETLRGPFEWDVKRLAASIAVAGAWRGFAHHLTRNAMQRMVRSYQAQMLAYASMPAIDVYYARVDLATVRAHVEKRERAFLAGTVHAAHHHDAAHELRRLTVVDSAGGRRIADQPPLITHPQEVTSDLVQSAFARYRESLQEDRRGLLDRYTIVDLALKVVGVGSVGLAAFAVLLIDGGGAPLFLQVKQAEASVLERYLRPSREQRHGVRVVVGQRRLQAVSDILLGWSLGDLGRHWYVRQLQDQKASADVATMTAEDLATWGELCGWALARGHARSGTPAEIAGYLGTDDAFERAMGAFAAAYADQNDRDHAAFVDAIAAGRIPAAAEPAT